MRIRRLDLMRFGPFAGQSLVFEQGEFGLHLIYGPNEAGKSSALRALRQLLFGIPGEKSCRDHFRHSHADLRIGGQLEDADGTRMTVIRRKGRQNSLRAADDKKVVDTGRLGEMLGQMDGDRFAQQFGIDYPQLRTGGQAIVTGGGDMATSLFAAGSGAGNLVGILRTLEQHGEDLFKPGGKNPKVNAAIAQLLQTRKRMKDVQLSATDWQRHHESLEAAKTRRDQLDSEIMKLRTVQTRLETVHKALPLIVELEQTQTKLEELGDIPQLQDQFTEIRRGARANLEAAEKEARNSEQQIAKLTEDIDQLNVSDELLQHAEEIQELYADLGRYRQLLRELPERVVQRDEHECRAMQILQDLGHPPELSQAEELRLTVAQRQQIRDLASQESGISKSVASARKRLLAAQQKLKRAEDRLEKLQAGPDGRPLAAAVRRIQKLGDLDHQLHTAEEVFEQAAAQSLIAMKKQLQWPGTLEELQQLSVPSADSVGDFGRRFDQLERSREALQEKRRAQQQQLIRIDGDLEKLTLEQDVPTEGDLAAARSRRDQLWQMVRGTVDRDNPNDQPAAPESQFENFKDLAGTYEQAVEAADHMADRLRREEQRVAEKARLVAEQHSLQRHLQIIEQDLQNMEDEGIRLVSDWEDLWEPAGIVPRTVREMSEWLISCEQLTRTAQELRRDQLRIETLAGSVQQHCAELKQLLDEVGRPAAPNGDTLQNMLELAENVAEELGSAAREYQDLQKELQRLERDRSAAEEEFQEAAAAQADWQRRWLAAVTPLNSGDTVTASAASAILDSIDELMSQLTAARTLSDSLSLAQAEIDRFEAVAGRLVEQTKYDRSAESWADTVSRMHDLVAKARKALATQESKQQQRDTEQSRLDEARAEAARCSELLAELCREAGCTSVEELPLVERKAAEQQQLHQETAGLQRQLQQLAGGQPLTDFAAEARQEEGATLEPRIAQLNLQIERLRQDVQELSETIGQETAELARMDGSAEAAHAAQEAEQVLARLKFDSQEYVRLRLASSILKRSIERYRQNNQGPVLQRASQLFRELTLGAFAALQPEYGEAGETVLMGVRAGDGRLVGVEGMSEGTCDQLYLALRIASLEAYFDRQSPVPFIVDDILIQFDDQRCVAALQALAELSRQTQVIVFTHHQHLLDLASEHITDDGVLFTQSLAMASEEAAARS